jgi:hypothetical protein
VPAITLLTDFGIEDPYAGIMKGVIAATVPGLTVIDLSHHVDPQDLEAAAFLLESAYPYFPEGTVHVVVVDPGVGGGRDIVAASASGHLFLAPDNGVLTRILETAAIETLVRVQNAGYFLQPVSRTFHGRDIFAPVAARMAAGEPLLHFGPAVSPEALVRIRLPAPVETETGELLGEVIAVDRFGNLITNIDERLLHRFAGGGGGTGPSVRIGAHTVSGLSPAYAAAGRGELLAIIGSRGLLEISVNAGDARAYCGAGRGTQVRVLRP